MWCLVPVRVCVCVLPNAIVKALHIKRQLKPWAETVMPGVCPGIPGATERLRSSATEHAPWDSLSLSLPLYQFDTMSPCLGLPVRERAFMKSFYQGGVCLLFFSIATFPLCSLNVGFFLLCSSTMKKCVLQTIPANLMSVPAPKEARRCPKTERIELLESLSRPAHSGTSCGESLYTATTTLQLLHQRKGGERADSQDSVRLYVRMQAAYVYTRLV